MANLDPRLGKRKPLDGTPQQGAIEYRPTLTIAGAPIEGVEDIIGLADGYYALLDTFLSVERRGELVAELETLIKGSSKKKFE